tara:strand:- start:877 stop:1065 length:189 start_codon:yes stop_codon:yes gene_type:complete
MEKKLLNPSVKIYAFLFLLAFPIISYSQTADFKVQHVQDDITNSGGSNNSFTTVSSFNKLII